MYDAHKRYFGQAFAKACTEENGRGFPVRERLEQQRLRCFTV
jgi:hypothetical protein